jgi:oxepin-CoA hydrolase/3-oxo-5,6-dehydrosuberyl-CoA semialdehyde dehydrogenase
VSRKLESYAAGHWYAAPDDGRPLLDAATAEEVARVSSEGLNLGEMVAHARTVGGPAIRSLTFHERAGMIKALAKHLSDPATGIKDELYELSFSTGATKRDSWVDIDGGFGTLFGFASKGVRELPNDTVAVDGNLEQLGRAGTFVGQHVYTSRPGVAVQINAFNFPVWGMLEKLAPAFLAGLPSIVKPAAQTAYVTELAVRRIIEAGILPEGSLQLVCGSPAGLLDELTVQDSVAFTGSAHTAGLLRNHTNVLHGGVQLGVEADSLNCSVLGPDVAADDPELELFVKGVVTEMTVKAGQKCTAIRRVLVPSAMADTVIEAIRERLARVTVGDPRNDDVRMGALVSLDQREEVRKAIQSLRASGDVVFGDADHVDVVDADEERGAFLSPVLLRAQRGAVEPHDVEPFGPVSSVVTYDSLDEAVELAARGKGSLVASVVTHDPEVARSVVLGLAPWHGRVLVLDRDDAGESTGHGSPLPMLVHGGPGRAGGGEELGGVRAVFHHMQRTAIQASPAMTSAITGRWTTGAPRREDAIHPFRKSLAELRVGDTIATPSRTVTLEDIDHFAEFTGDTFYAHTDPEAAAANPLFGGIVAHGYLVVSLAAGLFVDPDPGPVLANFGVDSLRFLTPVKAGDSIAVTLTVKQITPRTSADYGEVRWDALVTNQDGDPVATYDVLTLVAK